MTFKSIWPHRFVRKRLMTKQTKWRALVLGSFYETELQVPLQVLSHLFLGMAHCGEFCGTMRLHRVDKPVRCFALDSRNITRDLIIRHTNARSRLGRAACSRRSQHRGTPAWNLWGSFHVSAHRSHYEASRIRLFCLTSSREILGTAPRPLGNSPCLQKWALAPG